MNSPLRRNDLSAFDVLEEFDRLGLADEAPEGLDLWQLESQIGEFCSKYREGVVRATLNEYLRPHGWRLQRIPGWKAANPRYKSGQWD